MRYTVTGTQMKQIDRHTIEEIGIPSVVLMERAALAVAEAVCAMLGGKLQVASSLPGNRTEAASGLHAEAVPLRMAKPQVLIACGTGNNGADGIAVGRILQARGCEVTMVLAGNLDHATEEHRLQQHIAENLGLKLVKAEDIETADQLPGGCEVMVDALFGIGLERPIEGGYRKLMELLKEVKVRSGAKVVAVDIPSGIHADTGEVMGIALPADVTVTFGYEKSGLLLYPGRSYAGRVEIAEIGFAEMSLEAAGRDAAVLEPEDLNNLPERQADGNKGTFGKVLLIAGSVGMSGAAYLSALAAYRTGAGLVKVLTVPENRPILQAGLPEAIVEVYDPEAVLPDGSFDAFLESQCDWADVIVMGPGLGQDSYVESLVEMVLSHAYVPVVLDADGLNAVAEHPHLTRYFTENIILTPHMGEMSRLTGMAVPELKADPLQAARDYSSRHSVVCVMKDAATVIAEKEGAAYINASGCSAMAKAGSGDVLTGVIAGLLARGMECVEAAAYGVYLHGLAGEAAAEALGANSLLARDIAEHLSRI